MLETIEVLTADSPGASVIWLHGLGADGHDFEPIVPELALHDPFGRPLPVRFVFPHAPVMPVTINNGYAMRAWYDILGFGPGTREDEAGLEQSRQAVAELIEAEIARGIASRRIVLAGFSQGCAMTLLTGLRYGKPLGGLIALSGYLPRARATEAERHQANLATPIFMAHGSFDPVVDVARGEASRNTLTTLGHAVTWRTYPMQHAVCAEEIADVAAFIRGVLNQ